MVFVDPDYLVTGLSLIRSQVKGKDKVDKEKWIDKSVRPKVRHEIEYRNLYQHIEIKNPLLILSREVSDVNGRRRWIYNEGKFRRKLSSKNFFLIVQKQHQ